MYQNPIPYKQGSNAISLQFNLIDFDIQEGSNAKAYVQKPSGNATYREATIFNNKIVIVDPSTDMFSEPGINNIILEIKNGENILYSFNYPVDVEENPLSGDVEEGQNNPDIIQKIIDRLDQIEESGGGIAYKVGRGLKITEGNTLEVDAVDEVQQDNTKPITSAAVFVTVGNIEALLKTI